MSLLIYRLRKNDKYSYLKNTCDFISKLMENTIVFPRTRSPPGFVRVWIFLSVWADVFIFEVFSCMI